MYTAGDWGGEKIFFKRANFFNIPPRHTEYFDIPPLDQTKKMAPTPPQPLLTRKVTYGQYDEKVQRLMFKIEHLKQKVTKCSQILVFLV